MRIISYFTAFVFLLLFVITIVSIYRGAPYVASDKKTMKKIIKLLGKIKGTKVADLGSGDGRIVCELAKRGAYVVGYEINPFLIIISRIKLKRLGLEDRALIRWQSYWSADLNGFDAVFVFGMGHIMGQLERKLRQELKKGAKVVAYSFFFPNWKSSKELGGLKLYIR